MERGTGPETQPALERVVRAYQRYAPMYDRVFGAVLEPGRDIRLHEMDGESLAFADGSFDFVVLPYVLSVTPNPARLVAEVRRVCRKGGVILILNHFTGSHFWWLLERIARPMADRIGFRSDFDYAEQVLRHDWSVQAVKEVNLLGLSKLVTIRNV